MMMVITYERGVFSIIYKYLQGVFKAKKFVGKVFHSIQKRGWQVRLLGVALCF